MSNLPTTTLPLPALIMNDSLLENGQVRKEEDICHGDEREDTWFERKFGRLTNLQILIIISVLFTLFVVAEIVGALAGNSLSLLGDAAAMSVDVFTYFTNMYAEVQKKRGNKITESTRYMLEVYIPSFSVCALLGVTGWITSDAIQVIISNERDDDVDVAFLYGFACANFLVDCISSGLFYLKRKDVLLSEALILKNKRSFILENEEDKKQKTNLNMISALTHVGGDTMRTLSVFFAAVISTAGQPSSLCDAWAAIVVSFTICIAVIPLVKEIYKAATEKQ